MQGGGQVGSRDGQGDVLAGLVGRTDGSGAQGPGPAVASPPVQAAPPDPAGPQAASRDIDEQARHILVLWRDGKLPRMDEEAMRRTFELLRRPGERSGRPGAVAGTTIPEWYVPLLSDVNRTTDGAPCWPNAVVAPESLPGALFWLDLLSASETFTLKTFSPETKNLLLEVALSPGRISECARRTPNAARAAENSLYLREIGRNPGFLRFIVRDLPPFALDVAGASITLPRYVVTQGARRMYEGAAPDRSSRLVTVGELGVSIQLPRDVAAVVFDPDLTWKIMR